MADTTLIDRLKDSITDEGKSCSKDIAGIALEYVYRMWRGSVAIEEIEEAMRLMVKS